MLVCKYCGSENIVRDAWVDPNTLDVLDIFDNFYCNNCETTAPFAIPKEEFEENQKPKK